MPTAFAQNLRQLCQEHRSVAEVCRRLGINRQQFNKYLGGASLPSAHTPTPPARFCGLEQEALLLPAAEFRARRRALAPAQAPLGGPDSAARLRRYLGWYQAYYKSPAYPGRILCSLARFSAEGEGVRDDTIERLKEWPRHEGPVAICKYRGRVVHAGERIYIQHSYSLHHQVLGLAILYASQRARQRLLSGVFVSVSGGPGRQPFAARLVYEFLGQDIEVRAGWGAAARAVSRRAAAGGRDPPARGQRGAAGRGRDAGAGVLDARRGAASCRVSRLRDLARFFAQRRN